MAQRQKYNKLKSLQIITFKQFATFICQNCENSNTLSTILLALSVFLKVTTPGGIISILITWVIVVLEIFFRLNALVFMSKQCKFFSFPGIAPSFYQTGSALEGKISIPIAWAMLIYPPADMQLYAHVVAAREDGKG